MKLLKPILLLLLIPGVLHSRNSLEEFVLGKHLLTLQWISWEKNKTGIADIYKKDGVIYLDGNQTEGENYLKLNGVLRIIDKRTLEFEGKIITRIDYINSGKPYERFGKFILKAWGKRQYWRMQKMTQPDGSYEVTDYIDLYFQKVR